MEKKRVPFTEEEIKIIKKNKHKTVKEIAEILKRPYSSVYVFCKANRIPIINTKSSVEDFLKSLG